MWFHLGDIPGVVIFVEKEAARGLGGLGGQVSGEWWLIDPVSVSR